MSKNFKILAITFSVTLNIAFLSSWFYHKSGLGSLAGRRTYDVRPLYKELDLNRGQLHRLKPLRDRFHAFINEQGRKIKAKQLDLVDLLARERPDRRAIDAKREEIQALQRQMQARVITHLLEESRIFTPEQRQKFFALIKRRIEEKARPRPRWMPRKSAIPSKGRRP